MDNLEEKLSKIKVHRIAEDVKESLWHRIMLEQIENKRKKKLSINIFNINMNKLIIGALALMLVLGGGSVVAASNGAGPGDLLFPLDLAIEKIQIRLAGEEKRNELKIRFAEERVEEIKRVSAEKTVPAELITDLSDANISEIEADVFTNETIVKIEADNKNFGYFSAIQTRSELVKEISEKYSIPEEKVDELLSLEMEDRASRPEDKGFLNKTHSIVFSQKENKDVGRALTDLEELLSENENDLRVVELKQSLQELMVLLGDDAKLEIRKEGGRIKIENKNGEIKIKIKSNNSSRSGGNDANLGDDSDDDSTSSNDVREDDSEIFCRGEWRDPEDCNETSSNNSGSSKSSDDNSGSDKNNEDEKNDNSGSGGEEEDD